MEDFWAILIAGYMLFCIISFENGRGKGLTPRMSVLYALVWPVFILKLYFTGAVEILKHLHKLFIRNEW